MELNINVTTSNKCQIVVSDISKYYAADQPGKPYRNFKYSDTISIDVLYNDKSDKIYKKPIFTKHDTLEPINIPINFDGYFKVVHIVIPTIEWFNREHSLTEASALDQYSIVYYSDGKNIYKYIRGETPEQDINQRATIQEVLNANIDITTVLMTEKELVSICFLRKCYVNLCQQIFEDRRFSNCWNKNKVDSELVYKRDLVWMAFNVIKYLTEREQLSEVNRIFEIIHGCNGLCNSSNLISSTNGCGCSK